MMWIVENWSSSWQAVHHFPEPIFVMPVSDVHIISHVSFDCSAIFFMFKYNFSSFSRKITE
jgi:hypothetical protein